MKILIFILILFSFKISAQTNEFKTYEYINEYSDFSFSFEIPKDWMINGEIDGTGYFLNCKSNNEQKFNIKECYEGINFRIKYFNGSIDSAIKKRGIKKNSTSRKLETWLGFDRNENIKIIVPIIIEKNNLSILHYSFEESYKCQTKKKKKKVGKTQFIYFSDGKKTICFETDGKKLDDKHFEKLIHSFSFK